MSRLRLETAAAAMGLLFEKEAEKEFEYWDYEYWLC